MPVDQSFIIPIYCKNTDTLATLEQKVYNEYPQYKDYHTYLTVGGEIKKRFKTIDENGIKNTNAAAIAFLIKACCASLTFFSSFSVTAFAISNIPTNIKIIGTTIIIPR